MQGYPGNSGPAIFFGMTSRAKGWWLEEGGWGGVKPLKCSEDVFGRKVLPKPRPQKVHIRKKLPLRWEYRPAWSLNNPRKRAEFFKEETWHLGGR